MTDQIKDGGNAFPFAVNESYGGEQFVSRFAGMTLRDWFAGQAMVGLLASAEFLSPEGLFTGKGAETIADAANILADAMLKAREPSNG